MNNRPWLGSPYFAPVWWGLLCLALALRAYHLPGFVVNNDEGHWLVYALHPQLLFEPLRNSYPRPDILFPLLVSVLIKFFGPNELALRFCPMLLGTLSLLPLADVVFRLGDDARAAFFAALFLAVLPLHVYFSAQGIPDPIALFFGLYALAALLRARQTNGVASFIGMGIWLALALVTKATALYFWAFLAFAGIFLFQDKRRRRLFYTALALAVLPLILVTIAILLHSQTISFFREPGVTEKFGFSLARLVGEIRNLISFCGVLWPVAAIGAVLVVFRATSGSSTDRNLLIWLLPLANLFITPIFRTGRVELLWLIPSLCLYAAMMLSSVRQLLAWSVAGVVAALLLVRSLWGVPLPYPGRAKAATDYTTAVLDRPAHWPSRDAARWLSEQTLPEDTILFVAYTFTDPLLLELSQSRRVFVNAGENWPLLRDPANRVKYVVFTQDYRAYAPSLATYADTHFTMPDDGQFPNYAIYDCQKDGRLVAYPDAYDSASQYVRMGMEFLQQHQLESAVKAFEKALEVNPKQPVAGANLALLYYQLGREADGIALCERNIQLGIDRAISYGVLGQIRERQGDLAAAQAAYEASLSFDSQNQTTLQLLVNLRTRLRPSGAPTR